MKIIQPSHRPKKNDSSSVAECQNAVDENDTRRQTADSSCQASKITSNTRQPRSKKKHDHGLKRRSKFSNNDSQLPLDNSAPEEEFDFDTGNLEAMPKEDVFDMLPKGKKRRRSEIAAEKASEPLALVTDPAKKEFNELFARGVRLLAMREHSVQEITKKLFDKSENSSAIHAVVDKLLEEKYLSDERFAESYIRSRANRGFGPVKIKAELKSKGVSNTLIQDHLDEGAAIWFDNAQSQYKKKYASVPIRDYSGWAKRGRFLQGRGFTMEQIQVTVPQFSSD